MARVLRYAIVLSILALLSGCSRLSASTKIAADGSFTREVKYVSSGADLSGLAGSHSTNALDSTFQIPQPADNVIVNRTTENSEQIVTVTRNLKASSPPLQDITTLNKSGTPQLTSTVTVEKLRNGNLHYVEALHWLGPRSQGPVLIASEIEPTIRDALPDRFRDDATVKRLSEKLVIEMVHLLMGPPQPVMAMYMLDPDLGAHQMSGLAEQMMRDTVRETLPDMTDQELHDFFRALTNSNSTKSFIQQKSPANSGGGGSEPTPLTFAVSFPGRAIKTNGLTDPTTGEVYWSLFQDAVSMGDVTLEATIDPGASPAASGPSAEPSARGISVALYVVSVVVVGLVSALMAWVIAKSRM